MKLAIGIPTYDRWEADFGASLALAMVRLVGRVESMHLTRSDGSIASDARNDIIKEVLETEATHILWCDTDHKFKPGAVLSLISRNLDFVAADYVTRLPPHRSVARDLGGDPLSPGEGLIEVQQCGLGLALMRTAMFHKMTYPWSGFFTHEDGTLDDSVWVCRNARKVGYKLFIDRDATRLVGHVGKKVFTIMDAGA